MILNTKNNKVYVGSSVDISERWKRHKSGLNNNKHYNTYLQSSWNKYQSESFQFSILELCSEELLTERENHWCTIFDSHNKSKGYNLASIMRNGPSSEEHKKLLSSKTTNKKRVWLTDRQGNILNVFESNQQAADILNTTVSHIQFLTTGKVKKFDNQFLLWDTNRFFQKDIQLRNQKRIGSPSQKQIFQFSIDGQLLNSFPSIKEAISQSQILNLKYLIDSGINNIGGSLWSYMNTVPSTIVSKNIKYVYQYSLDKILLNTFESIVEASIKTNSKTKGIQKVLSGERNHHNSFIWSRDILSV